MTDVTDRPAPSPKGCPCSALSVYSTKLKVAVVNVPASHQSGAPRQVERGSELEGCYAPCTSAWLLLGARCVGWLLALFQSRNLYSLPQFPFTPSATPSAPCLPPIPHSRRAARRGLRDVEVIPSFTSSRMLPGTGFRRVESLFGPKYLSLQRVANGKNSKIIYVNNGRNYRQRHRAANL